MSTPQYTREYFEAQLARAHDTINEPEPHPGDRAYDPKGGHLFTLVLTQSWSAICSHMLGQPRDTVREAWHRAAHTQWRMFELEAAGEPIDHSYFTWLIYQECFIALAAGMDEHARAMLTSIRGRGKTAEQVHKFDRLMGKALAETLLEEPTDAALTAFEAYCLTGRFVHFRGYGSAMRALRARDGAAFAAALGEIVTGHKPLASRGVFRHTPSQFLCVWGIGLARYAHRRGLVFDFDHPFIPAALIEA